jgi:hypothetical protein
MQYKNRLDHGFIDEASSLLSFRGSYVEAMSASQTKTCGKYQTMIYGLKYKFRTIL